MDLERSFLQDILGNPDDLAPRLVYADWLEEHGDEEGRARGELIHVQCEAERLAPGSRARTALERRARALLAAHGKEWTAALKDVTNGKNFEFRRGFVEHLTMTAMHFIEVAEEMFAEAPIRSLHFFEASNEVTELAACPHLARLRELDLRYLCQCGFCNIHAELRDLFASPHAANLARLVLSRDRMTPAVTRALTKSPHLTRLRSLDLAQNNLETTGVRALAEWPAARELKSLDLGSNSIDKAAGRVLAGSPGLAGLEELVLRDNQLGDTGAKALARSANIANLKTLDLRENGIGDAGAQALLDSAHLRADVRLRLAGNTFSEDVAGELKARFGKRVLA